MTEHRIFHVLFYYEKISLKGIQNCTYSSCFNNDKHYFCILGWKIATDKQKINFMHEQFNQYQYFTPKNQIRTVNLLYFFFKSYIWRSKFIANYCRLKCLLQYIYMIFSACVKWQICWDKRFSFAMLRRIPRKNVL